MTKSSGARRFLPLDVLRSAAIFLVMAKHCFPLIHDAEGVTGALAEFFHRGGWMGVDLFFVLSGFLISGLLFREYQRHGNVRVGRFLIRRGFKIYPAFYVFIAYSFFIHFQSGPNLRSLLSELLFIQNYFYGIWGHTWTLAVEEHFYFFIALVVYLRVRRGSAGPDPFQFIPRLFVLLGSSMLAARILNTIFFEFSQRTHLVPTLVRMDSLMFGVLISYYYNFHHERFAALAQRHRRLLLWGGAALVLPPFFFELSATPLLQTVGLAAIYVGCGMLLSRAIVGSFPSHRAAVWLGKIGSYSYSIYLWHLVARSWVASLARALGNPFSPEVLVLIYFVVCVAVGVLTALAVEMPVLRLRDRFFPSRIHGGPA